MLESATALSAMFNLRIKLMVNNFPSPVGDEAVSKLEKVCAEAT